MFELISLIAIVLVCIGAKWLQDKTMQDLLSNQKKIDDLLDRIDTLSHEVNTESESNPAPPDSNDKSH